MEPRIQYAKTSDGVRIAFWTQGEGPPLVRLWLYPGAAPSQMYSYLPEHRAFLDALGRRLKLIHIDYRGTGHSERAVSDFSIESLVSDLESVVDRLELDRFALYASSFSAPVSFAYIAKHPRRVSHLILWHGSARGPDLSTALSRAVASMAEVDWVAATETVAHFQWGVASGQDAHAYAAALRESVTRETFRAQFDAASRFDATDLIPLVTAPTLMFHRRDSFTITIDEARDLASRLPDAHLVLLERSSMAASLETVPIVEEFLGVGEAPSDAVPTLPSGTAVILFADIADSTALTERLGDAAFRAKARELGPALRALVRECAGTPVEGPTLGDGVLAVFTSAREAIGAALRCAAAGEQAGLPLHLGLHAGDVTREKDPDGRGNVYGGAVNIAARISGLSAPGEVLVSETVRSLARTSAGVAFEDRGEQALKGVGEPVQVWAVRPGEA